MSPVPPTAGSTPDHRGPPVVVHLLGWRSQQYGSFERFLVEVGRLLASRGAQLHLVLPDQPVSQEFLRDVEARVHLVPLARHPGDPRSLWPAWQVLRSVGATHLHVHHGLDSYQGLLLGRAAGVRHRFATKHNLPAPHVHSAARQRLLASQVRLYFAVSREVEQALLRLGVPREKVELSYLGVDAGRYRASPEQRWRVRRELGLGQHDRVVLSTSHLRPGKGAELLPDLAEALADPADPRVVVVAAGGGPLLEWLSGQARRPELQGRLRVLGVRQDVPALLSAADLFVFPTTGTEGLGLGVLEALAAGVPVVAAPVSDLPELAEGVVRFAPPKGRHFAAACWELLRNEGERQRVGAAGQALVAERLDVRAGAQHYVEQYEAAGGRWPGPGYPPS